MGKKRNPPPGRGRKTGNAVPASSFGGLGGLHSSQKPAAKSHSAAGSFYISPSGLSGIGVSIVDPVRPEPPGPAPISSFFGAQVITLASLSHGAKQRISNSGERYVFFKLLPPSYILRSGGQTLRWYCTACGSYCLSWSDSFQIREHSITLCIIQYMYCFCNIIFKIILYTVTICLRIN